MNPIEERRRFLRYLAASPALILPQSTRRYAGLGDGPITDPEQAIDVFDFEVVAEKTLPPAHWGYLSTGTDDDNTIRANREGFKRYQLRPRRLIDVRKIDMSTTLFGETWPSPIAISPTGRNQAFHPEGELAVARAARAKNHLEMLSTVASTGVEDVIEARGAPIWYQLYARYTWDITEALVKRAEAAGCTAIVLGQARDGDAASGHGPHRRDRRPPGRKQSPDEQAAREARRARVHFVPRAGLRGLYSNEADVRWARRSPRGRLWQELDVGLGAPPA